MPETIQNITGREILDSRGNPTLEVTVVTENHSGVFAVPAGVSAGEHEAHQLRDNDKHRFGGKGVQTALSRLQEYIVPALHRVEITSQKEIDTILQETDGTKTKEFLGGNTVTGTSLAAARAAANSQGQELFEYLRGIAEIPPSRSAPLLFMNIIEGGLHASSPLAFQEIHLVPQTESIEEGLRMGWQIQAELKKILQDNVSSISTNVGDEGGFVPNISDISAAFEYLKQAAQVSNSLDGVKFSTDVAASSFYKEGSYRLGDTIFTRDGLLELYSDLIQSYPISFIEDPFEENDFESFAQLHKQYDDLLVVGDDLTVTDSELTRRALEQKSINALIVKPNQAGTLSETLETMQLARENNLECIVSHRGGETNDSFVADLAFAFGCFGIKAGGLRRGERLAKYNRLWQIERSTTMNNN